MGSGRGLIVDTLKPKDWRWELAPTGRAKCRQCGTVIPQGAIRLIVTEPATFGRFPGQMQEIKRCRACGEDLLRSMAEAMDRLRGELESLRGAGPSPDAGEA